MIKTDNLTFHYNQEEHKFGFPDIALGEEEDLLIVGKSGVGKTTLLHLLAGLLKPVAGDITIGDEVINTLSANKLDTFRGQHIGIVFQNNHAVKSLNVVENLKARLYFAKQSIDNKKIDQLLDELGLLEFKNRKVNTLSEGQLQRLAIASSVVHNPKVILADEPTSSLDDENCEVVINLLKAQAKKSKANLIVITHDNRIKPFFKNSIAL